MRVCVYIFYSHTCGIWKFLGQVSNQRCSWGYAIAMAKPYPSRIFNLCCSLWQCWILNPLSQARIDPHPHIGNVKSKSLTCWATTGTLRYVFFTQAPSPHFGMRWGSDTSNFAKLPGDSNMQLGLGNTGPPKTTSKGPPLWILSEMTLPLANL